MVGLVVVSHSRALARAAVALAAEMLPTASVPVEIAAGLDETTFGTDAAAIAAAIASADAGDGVVVLMDLGSAVLSASLALEFLDYPVRERALLCPAPLVEGLIAAAVSAAGGADRRAVAAEATSALAGKQADLGEPAPLATSAPAGGPTDTVTVINPHGLHARPAARLVTAAARFDAEVEIRNRTTGSPWVPASSLSRVATLGLVAGHELEVRADGPQAQRAVDDIVALAGRAFDEPTSPEIAIEPAQPKQPRSSPAGGGQSASTETARYQQPRSSPALRGPPAAQAASPGIAIGPIQRLRPEPDISDILGWGGDESRSESRGSDAEWARVEEALLAVRGELRRIRTVTARDAGEAHAAIFDAHLLLLGDAELLSDVRSRIADGLTAPQAWATAASRVAGEFEALADPYLQGRAADVRAVGNQVLRVLLGSANALPSPGTSGPGTGGSRSGDGRSGSSRSGDDGSVGSRSGGEDPRSDAGRRHILIADDLTAADAARLDPAGTAGVLLAAGSPTSHAAILTRARGIPAVVGAGPAVLDISDGTEVALDGGTGEIALNPSADIIERFRARAAEQAAARRRAASRAGAPAVTRDGVTVAVGANVGSVDDARAAEGADLAGLVRTEFLFLDRDSAPGVDEQEAAYREIAEALGGRRITLRTLDVGGDKTLRYLPAPAEGNPFLGVRGLRHSLAHPAIFAEQLLAIVRVAHHVPVSVMFPMVSTVGELIAARTMLDEAITRDGRGTPRELHVGIMVEIPATALKAGAFTAYVDFISLGTNDLTQYALAAERGNAALAKLADPWDPGVLRLIDAACRGVAGKATVALCGEMASDTAAVPLLTGLGVRELSVTPRAIPAVKEAVRAVSAKECAAAAARALDQPDAAAVRALA